MNSHQRRKVRREVKRAWIQAFKDGSKCYEGIIKRYPNMGRDDGFGVSTIQLQPQGGK